MRRVCSALLLLAALTILGAERGPTDVYSLATTTTAAPPSIIGAPTLSDAAYLQQTIEYVGWRPEALTYVSSRVRMELTQWDQPSASGVYYPGAAPTLTKISVPKAPNTVGERVISHELTHALDDARGFRNEIAGVILYDVWRVAQDEAYPAAAWSARQVLQLRPESQLNDRFKTSFHSMLDRQDWAHLALAVWEGVAWDVGKLPPWFAKAYFPHLQPGAPVQEQSLEQDPDPAPADLEARTQRVVDLIASMCGPVLPTAKVHKPTVQCLAGRNTAWNDVPYPPLPGVGGRGPAAVDQPAFNLVVPTPDPRPLASSALPQTASSVAVPASGDTAGSDPDPDAPDAGEALLTTLSGFAN